MPLTKHTYLLFVAIQFLFNTPATSQDNIATSYHATVGVQYGLLHTDGSFRDANIVGYSIGLNTEKKLWLRNRLRVGFQYSLVNIGYYQSQISYESRWVSGLYHDTITLDTKIKQQFVDIPIIIKFAPQKWYVGVGVIIHYLLTSSINQQVIGEYDPPAQHPNGKESYNASLKHVLEKNQYTQKNALVGVQISPTLLVGYQFGKRFRSDLILTYDILKTPTYPDINISAYRLFRTSLQFSYQFNK